MNKALAAATIRHKHYAWLIVLGADTDKTLNGVTYRKLKSLERYLSRINEKACNGELEYDEFSDTYPEQERAEVRALASIINIFGRVPTGFEFNRDPRGYALKINDDYMRQRFVIWHNAGLNPYQDWGGYGILAPEF